ncbi:hypothetical protein RB595_006485 [Gaeumannomyces hyphopodioides]
MALFLATVAAAAAVLAAPAATDATATATEPCGTVGSSWAAQKAAGVEIPRVDAALAYACLTSIPIEKSTALKFVDELVPYLEWQSDAAYKKDPPEGYAYAGYDVFAELAAVRAGIAAGAYATEHGWQSELFERVFGAGHDGHMLLYPGETTTLTFSNGTVVQLRNSALLQGNWTGVVDAASFVRQLTPLAVPGAQVPDPDDGDLARRPGVSPAAAARSALSSTRAAGPWPGYPEAVAVSLDKSASGYFLSGPGFSDVAVLVLTSFSVIGFDVQAVVQSFYAKAVAAGKQKLVVDLQANEGGFIYLAYDMFRQLFPDIVQQGLGRRRLSPGFEALAIAAAAICKGFDPHAAKKVRDSDLWILCQSPLNYGYELDPALRHFESYGQKYAPHEYHGDRFTNLTGWDLGNQADSSGPYYGFGMNVTGYGDRTNLSRPFAGPDDIVVVYDGACASSCTVFSEFMVHHAGVKTVSLGGRPGNTGLTQGVGGVKGPQTYGFSDIKRYVDRVKRKLAASGNSTAPEELARYTNYVIGRTPGGALINFRDAILPGHTQDGTPSQYVTEYSRCRLFWTEEMVKSPEAVWEAAAGAAFKQEKCARGGF